MFEALEQVGFEIAFASHARAILDKDFPDVADQLQTALAGICLPMTEIVGSGGGEAQLTQRLRRGFADLHWRKRNIEMHKTVDGVVRESISHEIDPFIRRPKARSRSRSTKRAETFASAWSAMFFSDKYGMATTHWAKLQDRVRRGVGNPCPLVLVRLPPSIVDMNA